jgi:hypothetical protein
MAEKYALSLIHVRQQGISTDHANMAAGLRERIEIMPKHYKALKDKVEALYFEYLIDSWSNHVRAVNHGATSHEIFGEPYVHVFYRLVRYAIPSDDEIDKYTFVSAKMSPVHITLTYTPIFRTTR